MVSHSCSLISYTSAHFWTAVGCFLILLIKNLYISLHFNLSTLCFTPFRFLWCILVGRKTNQGLRYRGNLAIWYPRVTDFRLFRLIVTGIEKKCYLARQWCDFIPVCYPSFLLTFKVLNFWKFTSYCSLKPLWSDMGEVVPACTSPTLHPPSPPTVHQLSQLAL